MTWWQRKPRGAILLPPVIIPAHVIERGPDFTQGYLNGWQACSLMLHGIVHDLPRPRPAEADAPKPAPDPVKLRRTEDAMRAKGPLTPKEAPPW